MHLRGEAETRGGNKTYGKQPQPAVSRMLLMSLSITSE